MPDVPRKKSPRAPSIALDEALDRALRAYDKDRLHPAPTDVVAQNLGYKSASNGAALSALASLRYYGLLERPREGMLAVTKDVEAFKFAPSEDLKRSLLLGFLRRPALFSELLDKYESGLPSDATLKYDLIQRGFIPATAASFVVAFRRSIEFAGYYAAGDRRVVDPALHEGSERSDSSVEAAEETEEAIARPAKQSGSASLPLLTGDENSDRIPVRLTGGRRAWLSIPTPFYAADKQRLKAQIDLLLTEDDEDL